jgi:O-methyltransferase
MFGKRLTAALQEIDELRTASKRLLEERSELLEERERLIQERDEAKKELSGFGSQFHDWREQLLPFPGHQSGYPEWHLPPKPYLGTAPQRYTDNYSKYLDRGGKARPSDDIMGFVNKNPWNAYDHPRFYLFCLVTDLIDVEKLPGDFAELGVDKGNSASVFARAAARLGKSIYLLDTFEGFADQDLVGEEAKYRGQFTDTSLAIVKENVSGNNIRFIKGYFPESSAQIPDDALFSLVHLDCDLYKPFSSALDYFWPRLVPGGFLIMHDYMSLWWEGVEVAVNAFFANKTESIIPIPDMAGTIIVRKNKEATPK